MRMQNLKIERIICSFICAFLCLFGMTVSVFASERIHPDAKAGITIRYNEEGAEFTLYKVADVSSDVIFTPTASFQGYPLKWNGLDAEGQRVLAETLDVYVSRDKIPETTKLIMDAEGQAAADNLDTGLYLVIGKPVQNSDSGFTPVPFLVSLPSDGEDGSWDYHPVIDAKRKPLDSYLSDVIQRRVTKNWDDEGQETKRPDTIVVELLKDGAVEETVELNKNNNWSYIWKELSTKYEWKVMEKDVPEDYTVTVVLENKTFTITNTANNKKNSQVPGDDHMLPRTGQLWWPVPVLAFAGMASLLIGLVRKKTLGEDNA